MKFRYVLLLLSMLSLASCATVEGMGEDIETAGEAIQEGAEN